MNNLWTDLIDQIQTYYAVLVALLPKLALAVLVILFTLSLAGWAKRFTRRRLSQRMDDPLLANFLARLIKISLSLIGFLIVLSLVGLGAAAASVLAGAGISAFIIGFAFKDIGENFLAGILMAFKRPFRIGDVIQSGDIQGKIIGLSLRDTQVKTFDGKDVYLPNGMLLKNPLINSTIDGFLRNEFDLGIDYDSDLNKAIEVIYDSLREVDGLLWDENKSPNVAVKNLGASTVNITVYFWINTFDSNVSGLKVKTEAIRNVLTQLKAAGFYLPADIVELKNYNRESIASKAIS